jgi:hypothetical protein
MVSRKWLYSYRILTERLHDGELMPTSEASSFASAEPKRQQISVDDGLTESKPAKPALMLTSGGKS